MQHLVAIKYRESCCVAKFIATHHFIQQLVDILVTFC